MVLVRTARDGDSLPLARDPAIFIKRFDCGRGRELFLLEPLQIPEMKVVY